MENATLRPSTWNWRNECWSRDPDSIQLVGIVVALAFWIQKCLEVKVKVVKLKTCAIIILFLKCSLDLPEKNFYGQSFRIKLLILFRQFTTLKCLRNFCNFFNFDNL